MTKFKTVFLKFSTVLSAAALLSCAASAETKADANSETKVEVKADGKSANKVGFVDLQKAIDMTAAGKKAKTELEKEFESKKKELQKKEADLKKMQEDLEKKKGVLSEEVRNRRQAEFQQEVTKFQQTVAESEQTMRVRGQQLTQPILDKLQKAMAELGKEEGYSILLHQSERMQLVLWAMKDADVTEAVVARVEKMNDSKSGKKK